MSKLHGLGRPYVTFDPSNRNHRKIFNEAVKYKTWGRSPIRFIIEEESLSLMDQVQSKLLNYYLSHEFDSKVEENKSEKIVKMKSV